MLGNAIVIKCQADGYPIPTITWYKGQGMSYKLLENSKFQCIATGFIFFYILLLNIDGYLVWIYTILFWHQCATSSVSNKTFSYITMYIIYVITLNFYSNFIFTFICMCVRQKKLWCWYIEKTSKEFKSIQLKNNSLVIDFATETDEGYYMCQASNGIGTGLKKIIHINVNGENIYVY